MLKYGRNEKMMFCVLLVTNDKNCFGASLFSLGESLHQILSTPALVGVIISVNEIHRNEVVFSQTCAVFLFLLCVCRTFHEKKSDVEEKKYFAFPQYLV